MCNTGQCSGEKSANIYEILWRKCGLSQRFQWHFQTQLGGIIGASIGSGSWQPWRKSLRSSWRYSRRWTGEHWDHWIAMIGWCIPGGPGGPGGPRHPWNIWKSPENHRSRSSKQSANRSRIFRRRHCGIESMCGQMSTGDCPKMMGEKWDRLKCI